MLARTQEIWDPPPWSSSFEQLISPWKMESSGLPPPPAFKGSKEDSVHQKLSDSHRLNQLSLLLILLLMSNLLKWLSRIVVSSDVEVLVGFRRSTDISRIGCCRVRFSCVCGLFNFFAPGEPFFACRRDFLSMQHQYFLL